MRISVAVQGINRLGFYVLISYISKLIDHDQFMVLGDATDTKDAIPHSVTFRHLDN